MPPKQQQRFHGNRSNSMKIGLRGLVFTINPQNEPKAFRELAVLMEKVLADYPQEYFQLPQSAVAVVVPPQEQEPTSSNNTFDEAATELNDGAQGDEYYDQEYDGEDNNDINSQQQQQQQEEEGESSTGAGSCFADELQAELLGLKQDSSSSTTQGMVARSDSNNNATDVQETNQERKPRIKRNFPPRRFRMIDTNVKGFAFVAINFSDELEAADRIPVGAPESSNNPESQPTNVITIQQQQVFNFCVGKIPSLILEIAKKIVALVRDSDVPLLRFTYYLYPCLSTAAPTVHSAIVLAEATKILVPIPQGKSAAKIETHFTVRNNSGLSQPAVLDELKKQLKERLPMGKYFVTNANQSNAAASAAKRRQRENDAAGTNANNNPARVINASILYIVLHSAAMLCIQSDFSEMQEYALHRIGASFADSL